jgi:hypothetical protein
LLLPVLERMRRRGTWNGEIQHVKRYPHRSGIDDRKKRNDDGHKRLYGRECIPQIPPAMRISPASHVCEAIAASSPGGRYPGGSRHGFCARTCGTGVMPGISPAPCVGTHDGKTSPWLLVNREGQTYTPVYRTNVLYWVHKNLHLLTELWRKINRCFSRFFPQWHVMRSRRASRIHVLLRHGSCTRAPR